MEIWYTVPSNSDGIVAAFCEIIKMSRCLNLFCLEYSLINCFVQIETNIVSI